MFLLTKRIIHPDPSSHTLAVSAQLSFVLPGRRERRHRLPLLQFHNRPFMGSLSQRALSSPPGPQHFLSEGGAILLIVDLFIDAAYLCHEHRETGSRTYPGRSLDFLSIDNMDTQHDVKYDCCKNDHWHFGSFPAIVENRWLLSRLL